MRLKGLHLFPYAMKNKIVLIGLLLSCCFNISALNAQESKGTEKEYVISANDVLEISVYSESDLSVHVRVSQDGTINYPLLGNIKAAGFTVHELQAYLKQTLEQDYLVNAQVSVFVKEYAKISILGQVRVPGAYQTKENLTLTQAIAIAGGFTPSANTSNVKVIRSKGDKKETLEINVGQILQKAAADFEINANDTIIVEEYGRFSVIGQVAKPGIYSLQKNLTVIEAISLAGGFTPTAAQDATRVIRVEGEEKKIIPVPVATIMKRGDSSKDIFLQEGDTIVVPESFF